MLLHALTVIAFDTKGLRFGTVLLQDVWPWLAPPALLIVAWIVGRTLGWLTRRILGRLVKRTASSWDDALLAELSMPLTVAWAVATARALLPAVRLSGPIEAGMARVLAGLVVVVVAWVAWRTLGVAAAALGTAPWSRNNPAGQSVLVLGEITAKTATLAIAVATLLASLGYPVGSLMAGIGIGGFGLALAAQKTVENLFGSVSLATDQPFVLGDFVRIEDFVGTIEAIGLRSTRIRTLDRTVVSIPNGRLADMRLENYSARDRMRLACTVSLVYETTPAQMRAVLARIEKVLRSHPLIWPDAVVVRFKDLAASSLDIEVMAWFQTPEWSVFQAVRQEVLLQFMEVVESAGTSFAFPTRTIHVAPSPRGDGAGADRPTASEVQR